MIETGHASLFVAGSIVPARLFTSGWLNMSYVIWPVASPLPPASSNSVMLKPPSPGSFGDSTSTPPPPSCSPFSGKSSWNTNTDSFDGGYGSGCVNTVTALKAHVVAGGVIVHRSGTPPMPCPQAPGFVALALPLVQSGDRFAFANGLPASPGKTVR